MNRVRQSLVALALAGVLAGFVDVAPNRLVSGHAIAIWHALPPYVVAGLAGAVFALLWTTLRPGLDREAVYISAGLVLLLPALAGWAAHDLAARAPPATRILLGGGFWLIFAALALALAEAASRARYRPAGTLALLACLVGGFILPAVTGMFSALSLTREYLAHRAEFADALWRHAMLVAATVGLTTMLAVPLALWVRPHPMLRRATFLALSMIQTIPSVALFGLLITPLAALGFTGIGIVPALIALTLYALLPAVRAVVTGFDGVDPAVLEAARGMGFSPAQSRLRIALPLAAPALLAGLRLVVVQTIGLAVVAALIGAGGLGDFVFQGLGQYATDLVLLGALPAIGLALVADAALGFAARRAGA